MKELTGVAHPGAVLKTQRSRYKLYYKVMTHLAPLSVKSNAKYYIDNRIYLLYSGNLLWLSSQHIAVKFIYFILMCYYIIKLCYLYSSIIIQIIQISRKTICQACIKGSAYRNLFSYNSVNSILINLCYFPYLSQEKRHYLLLNNLFTIYLHMWWNVYICEPHLKFIIFVYCILIC